MQQGARLWLIASPGRTGSSFLLNYLTNYFALEKTSGIKIVQTHDATLQLASETLVICSRRRDLWQHTLSSVIAQHYDEWTEYRKEDEDFAVDFESFENKYLWNLRWFEAFYHYTRYDATVDLHYEDFINNQSIINQTLKLQPISYAAATKPSPHKQARITNLPELMAFYEKLQQNTHLHSFPITERCWCWHDIKTINQRGTHV